MDKLLFLDFNVPHLILGAFLGVGLAAAAGFRVFLPLFALSIATHFNLTDTLGLGTVSQTFAWIGTLPALISLGVATIIEIVAYYIPIVDNFLDSLAIPLAGTAGTILMASQLIDMSPLLTWGLAIIAGGGTAVAISGTTATGRVASTATTGGVGNFALASIETGASAFMSMFSFLIPILAAIMVVVGLIFIYRIYKYFKFQFKKENSVSANNNQSIIINS